MVNLKLITNNSKIMKDIGIRRPKQAGADFISAFTIESYRGYSIKNGIEQFEKFLNGMLIVNILYKISLIFQYQMKFCFKHLF